MMARMADAVGEGVVCGQCGYCVATVRVLCGLLTDIIILG